MDYLEVKFNLDPVLPARELLTVYLAEIGFESFVDAENGLSAFIQSELFSEKEFLNQVMTVDEFCTLKYELITHEKQNWNAQWESSFSPVEVEGKVRIRAPFHEADSGFRHEIIIEPKMSFGTGHHETTRTILKAMTAVDFNGKTVLDMGCGTGVLAIYAEKLGAASLVAIDIEEWAYENTLENIQVNNCHAIETRLGGKEQIKPSDKFDVVIANINRNILLADMHAYAEAMNENATLLLSGFYTVDEAVLLEKAAEFGLKKVTEHTENSWMVLELKL